MKILIDTITITYFKQYKILFFQFKIKNLILKNFILNNMNEYQYQLYIIIITKQQFQQKTNNTKYNNNLN